MAQRLDAPGGDGYPGSRMPPGDRARGRPPFCHPQPWTRALGPLSAAWGISTKPVIPGSFPRTNTTTPNRDKHHRYVQVVKDRSDHALVARVTARR